METGGATPTAETARLIDEALDAGGELLAMVRAETAASDASPLDPASDGYEDQWQTADLLERVRAADVSASTVEALHIAAYELCCTYQLAGRVRAPRREPAVAA